ncbi:hypothetical protein C8R34_11866 [Nitrosomonas sp. Nm84]|uniref:hypothetical protein n=1 Tax=Nitrosomonas sp. Nm84 TaxID=200124 RepID=UPI000D755FD1|nr:hypothetical protein [Nitrosomonas sp. Nm84]PXW85756.1 hypothetical protein C8R34_11866 [Nitrosomonas sp. Nm84]
MHPNCCEVTDQVRFDFLQSEFIARPGQKVPLMMRLTGMVSSYVLARYKLHYLDENGEEKLWKNEIIPTQQLQTAAQHAALLPVFNE